MYRIIGKCYTHIRWHLTWYLWMQIMRMRPSRHTLVWCVVWEASSSVPHHSSLWLKCFVHKALRCCPSPSSLPHFWSPACGGCTASSSKTTLSSIPTWLVSVSLASSCFSSLCTPAREKVIRPFFGVVWYLHASSFLSLLTHLSLYQMNYIMQCAMLFWNEYILNKVSGVSGQPEIR